MNKDQLKATVRKQNQYFDYLIDPCFLGVNRYFVLSFVNNGQWLTSEPYFFSDCGDKKSQGNG